MAKLKVTLTNGRIAYGEITTEHKGFSGVPVLVVNGQPYSALDAVGQGISVDNVSDPIFDNWLSTFHTTA